MLKLKQLTAVDSSRARTYYVLLSVAPGECAGKIQTCSELAWPRCVGVICAHEDVLVVQLPAPRVQGSREWDLWSGGAGGLESLPQLGWVVECFLQRIPIGVLHLGGKDRPDGDKTDSTVLPQRCYPK